MPAPHLPPVAFPLQIHTTIASLRSWRRTQLLSSRRVALVPTMGALHAGHISLIRRAALTHPSICVSIFVNPAQFAPHEDLDSYPRTLDSDISQLIALNAELDNTPPPPPPTAGGGGGGILGRIESVFLPSTSEIYPTGLPTGTFITVDPLSTKLEGSIRPHFFRGVATVCTKLFNIIQPETAFFGQKDVQQTVVIKRVVKDLCFCVEIEIGETVREEGDGLAMSSRNIYLGPKRRGVAGYLYKALKAAEEAYYSAAAVPVPREVVLEAAMKVLEGAGKDEGVKVEVEYVSVADGEELEELQVVGAEGAVLSAAVRLLPTDEGEGTVRIIDNVILKGR